MITNIYGAIADFHIIPASTSVSGTTFLQVRDMRGSLMTSRLSVCVAGIIFHRRMAGVQEADWSQWSFDGRIVMSLAQAPHQIKGEHWKILKTKTWLSRISYAGFGSWMVCCGRKMFHRFRPLERARGALEKQWQFWREICLRKVLCMSNFLFSSQCLLNFQLQN